MVDNLLPDLVGLPHVFDLAFHLDGKGGYETPVPNGVGFYFLTGLGLVLGLGGLDLGLGLDNMQDIVARPRHRADLHNATGRTIRTIAS